MSGMSIDGRINMRRAEAWQQDGKSIIIEKLIEKRIISGEDDPTLDRLIPVMFWAFRAGFRSAAKSTLHGAEQAHEDKCSTCTANYAWQNR